MGNHRTWKMGQMALMGMLALAVLATEQRARAGIVTFDFAGTDGITPFTGSFSYDTDTPADLSFGGIGEYDQSASFPMSFTIEQGGVSSSVTGEVGMILVSDEASGDGFIVNIFGPNASSLILSLGDSTGTAFSSDALPTSLDLSQFDSASLGAGFGENGQPIASGEITSLSLRTSAVPEPTTLVGAGLAGVGFLGYELRRRRKVAAA